MTDAPEQRGGRGGRRAGAGRPQQRISLDLETANILRELVRQWRDEHPDANYTANYVVEGLVWREAIKRGLLDTDMKARWLAIAQGETPE